MHYILTPYIVGIFLFFTVSFGISSFVNTPTCEDGWRSSSIGIQGACSHHGGVKEDPLRYFVIPAGLLAGIIAYAYSSGITFIRCGAEKYRRQGKVFCPKCDHEMINRNGKYGRFYGCKRYPHCRGTRTIAEGEASIT